ARVPLRVGAQLRFGSAEALWVLESDTPPDVVAIEVEGERALEGEHGLIRWDAQTLIFTDNGTDYWFESGGERVAIADRQVIEVAGSRFRISIPPPSDQAGHTVTADGILLSRDVTLQFQVSPDEENVHVRVIAEGIRKELRARSFDYMLLALARARLADAASGTLPEDEQGW